MLTVFFIVTVSVIHLTKNPLFHAGIKHIQAGYYFIRELINGSILSLLKIPSSNNPVDMLTKVVNMWS